MKKAITLLLLLFAAITATAQAWENVGTAGFSTGEAGGLVLGLDPEGTPHVAYVDYANAQKLIVKKFDGTSWVAIGLPVSAGAANNISLDFNTEGLPYVAYSDATLGNKTSLKRYLMGQWRNIGNAGFTPNKALYNFLAINGNNPFIAFQDWGNGLKASVMRYSGNAWVNVGPAGFSPNMAYYPSVAFASTGRPYVAFVNGVNDVLGKITVMRFNGTSWLNVGNPEFTAGSAYKTSLAIATGDIPYVAYRDDANGGKITVMRLNGSTWQNVGSAGFSAGIIDDPSIAIAPNGVIYVAFRDGGNDGQATVMKFNGTSWESVGTGLSEGSAYNTSIAFNALNTPYVAYTDWENGRKATVKKLPEPVTQIKPAFCGITVESIGTKIYAIPVPEATSYRFKLVTPLFLSYITTNENFCRLYNASPRQFSTVHTIQVAVGINGVYGPYGPACDVRSPNHPVTQLTEEFCNTTVESFSTNIYADYVPYAAGYRFTIDTDEGLQTISTTDRYFRLNQLSSSNYPFGFDFEYNKTYTITVDVEMGDAFGYSNYGAACTITSPPVPLTQLNAASCGITGTGFSTNLYANPVTLADGYRFRVTNGANEQIIEGPASYFRLKQLASYEYNTYYNVEVAVSVNGVYGPYGPACTVATPAPPLTQLRAQDCGITVEGFGTNLYANEVALAEGYRFRVTNGATVDIVDWPTRNFRIKMLPSYTYNTTYNIEVAVMINGVYGPYGPACDVSTPASGLRQNIANDEDEDSGFARELTIFPNPFETSFSFALETESDEAVTIQAYDITGKMLDTITTTPEELSELKIGENYAAGIYSVIVTQGSFTKAVKMVKK